MRNKIKPSRKFKNNQNTNQNSRTSTNAGLPKQNNAANNGDAVPGATLALPRRRRDEY